MKILKNIIVDLVEPEIKEGILWAKPTDGLYSMYLYELGEWKPVNSSNIIIDEENRKIVEQIVRDIIGESVPTKVSQLENDSSFISDSSYVHTDNNFTTILKNKLNAIPEDIESTVNKNSQDIIILTKSIGTANNVLAEVLGETNK